MRTRNFSVSHVVYISFSVDVGCGTAILFSFIHAFFVAFFIGNNEKSIYTRKKCSHETCYIKFKPCNVNNELNDLSLKATQYKYM